MYFILVSFLPAWKTFFSISIIEDLRSPFISNYIYQKCFCFLSLSPLKLSKYFIFHF